MEVGVTESKRFQLINVIIKDDIFRQTVSLKYYLVHC